MTAAWFEIDPDQDRMPVPLQERYRLRDPWGDYAHPGEVIPITFAGSTRHGRALVTGHDADGQAVVLPLDPDVVLIYSDPPQVAGSTACTTAVTAGGLPSRAGGGGVATTPTSTPLTRESSPFATGGEAS